MFSNQENSPVFSLMSFSMVYLASRGKRNMSRRGGKTCSFDLFENFKTPKFADTQFWLDTDAKDQICLSSLSNAFLNACLTGGSNYQGSLWVESNTDDRALLLLDLMSGCPHRSHWQTGVKGAPPPHWKDRRKHTLPTLGELSEYKPEVGTGERRQWFSSFVPSRCQTNCVTWKSFLFSLHLFSIKHSHSHWLVWNWDTVTAVCGSTSVCFLFQEPSLK